MPAPNTTYEVTCRTVQSRFLLKPSVSLNILILGVIGRALSLFGVNIHLFVVASNHMHLLISADSFSLLSRFMCHINSNIAREAGRLYSWREKFWGRRFSAIPILDDESLINRARYLISHGCKEGLVARPGDWPGVNCIAALTKGIPLIGRWINRSLMYADSKKPTGVQAESAYETVYEVQIRPLHIWAELSEPSRQRNWQLLVDGVIAETKQRNEREGTQTLGVNAIFTQDPHSMPKKTARWPRPFCHTIRKKLEKEYRAAYREFVGMYREAFGSLLSGHLKSLGQFPEDCYIPPFAYLDQCPAPG